MPDHQVHLSADPILGKCLDWPIDRPTNQATNETTDKRVHGQVTLPNIKFPTRISDLVKLKIYIGVDKTKDSLFCCKMCSQASELKIAFIGELQQQSLGIGDRQQRRKKNQIKTSAPVNYFPNFPS